MLHLFVFRCILYTMNQLNTALIAQLDRVPDYESGGYRFDSC